MAPPSTTHNYVRFEPQNLDQIMLIHDLGYELEDVPLDQDIEFTGDYYHHAGLPDSLNYFYTLIPANYSIIQTVPHSILGQVVLFDEDAGDEQDPEEDPWIPDPGCEQHRTCYCYDEWGQAYVCGTDPRIYLRKKAGDGLPEDLIKKSTKYLLGAGIDLEELYNEAMKLAGYENEVIDSNPSGRAQSVRYYPAGQISVNDNSLNQIVPVKNVRVKARRFFKMKTVHTNNSGYFYIDKGFRNKATVLVKFKNDWAKVRGINGALKLWQYVTPIKKKLGTFEKSVMATITYTFAYSSNANSMAALQFAAAHCLNTLTEMREYCSNNGLLGFAPGTESNLNIWISSVHTQGASAPMLRAIANTSLVSNAINYLLPGLGSAAKRIIQNYLPDVTLRLQDTSGNTRNAANVSGTFFHEFARTVHYHKAGNNFWVNLIAAIVGNGGYGSKTSSNAGHVAVAESWGFFIGPTFTRTKYSNVPAIMNAELNFLEFQRRDDSVPFAAFNGSFSRGWIPWGMNHDLIDVGEPAVTLINDGVSGYSINGIFKGFHQGSTNIQQLRAAILANNGNSQATQVNTLVTGYGW